MVQVNETRPSNGETNLKTWKQLGARSVGVDIRRVNQQMGDLTLCTCVSVYYSNKIEIIEVK